MTFEEELAVKVARMRALGVYELETSNGFVRRIILGPAPEVATVPEPIPSPPPAPVEPIATEARAHADETAKKAKAERLKFGAGK